MGEYGIMMKDEMVRALLRPVGDPLRKRVTRRTSDQARREGVEGRAEYLALWEAINGPVYPELLWRIALEEVDRG